MSPASTHQSLFTIPQYLQLRFQSRALRVLGMVMGLLLNVSSIHIIIPLRMCDYDLRQSNVLIVFQSFPPKVQSLFNQIAKLVSSGICCCCNRHAITHCVLVDSHVLFLFAPRRGTWVLFCSPRL